MLDSRSERHKGFLTVLGFFAVTGVLAPVAYVSMFSGFKAYDDEGYFLLGVKQYVAGQHLFTEAVSLYGPFYYEVMGGLFKLLGLAPVHDNGRLLILVIWLIGSLIGGLSALRLTGNVWLGLAAELVTFRTLTAVATAPMHPSCLVGLLLIALVGAATLRSVWPRATAVLIGGLVGALCLVKINVGAFAAIAVAFAWAGSLSQPWRRFFLPLTAVLIAILPFVLMARLLSQAWILEYAVLVAVSAAAVGVAGVLSMPRHLPAPSAGWLAAGAAVLAMACVGVALAGGTRLGNLLNAAFVEPLSVPQLFGLPLAIGPGNDLWAALWLVVAIAVCGRLARAGSLAAVGLARVTVGLAIWLSLLLLPNTTYLLALPLAWIAARPPRDVEHDSTVAYFRLFCPALAVLLSLQAFPVAGTQVSMGALGLVPLGAIILSDGIRQLRHAYVARPAPLVPATWVAPAALLVNLAFGSLIAFWAMAGFWSATPLGLRGAESVRAPAEQGTQLRALVASIDRDCSSFITFPGMNSFYFWTAKEPPVGVMAEFWWLEIKEQEQHSLVSELEPRQRLCVLKNQRVVDFWNMGRHAPQGPLIDFIDHDFVTAGSYGDYDLLIRKT